MKKHLLIILFCGVTLTAQNISEAKVSGKTYGASKMKKATKKLFINSFNVNYEIYKEAIDVKTGSSGFRGKRTGDATARAAIGLSGIIKDDIQVKTDQLYTEFVADYKAKGFEIVNIEQAQKIEIFDGWEKETGPYVKESGFPGVLTSIPTGYSFLYKKRSKSGKVKKGLWGGYFNAPIISKQLDNAFVVDIDLYVVYSEESSKGFNLGSLSKVAKVKINTNLRLAADYAIVAPKAPTKLGVFGSIGFKGATTVDYIRSTYNVSYSKVKVGAGAEGQYNGLLKKPIEISGVMKKEKVSAYQKQSSFTPTSFSSYGPTFMEDRFSKNATWVKVDSKKYAEGLYKACDAFLEENTKILFKKIGL
ncbi:hypothetical protein ACXGQW_04565 [Wenyingzhuangia sp. IMCC45533]